MALVQAYAQAFAQVGGLGVSVARDGLPSVEEIAKAIALGYRVIVRPDGTVEIEATGKEDHELLMDAVEHIGPLNKEPYYQEYVKAEAQRIIDQAQASSAKKTANPSSSIPSIAIGKALVQWLAEIKSSTKTKTFKIKTTAVEGFAKHYGEKNPLKDAQRIDVGNWVQALRGSKLETPTIVNKLSYLRGFFDWAKARGYYPSFSKDENPAAGQVVYGVREKRQRRALGFKPFSKEQVQALYDSKAMEKGLSESARWGAWIGLYTGARVAEVGQLTLADFVEADGIPCIRICDESEGQSVKSDVSIRTIPVHPALVRLGLLKRVNALRKAGETRLFPSVKTDGVNGMGNWLSKAFSRHVLATVGKPEKGKFGFHSLRKSVVQGLQTLGVPSEVRAAYVGHELDDEHHASYSRAPTMKELLDAVKKLDWNLS
ncbi:phage-related integrase [Dyella mobilis]|nr:phage-related integrase [Dyella mobilis]